MTTNQTTMFNVEGMTCGSCVRHIDQALREVDGVLQIEARLAQGEVVVTHQNASTGDMLEALAEAGYQARLAG